MQALFGGKKPDPREQAREWDKKLRGEMRDLDRQIRHIEREEGKVKLTMKQHAKKNEMAELRILAKSLVGSKKAKTRIHTTKTQINSISMEIKQQIRMLRMSNAIAKSTKVMESMNHMVNLQQVSKTMAALSREMAKAGVIEEMIEEAMPVDEDLEEEADTEVMKVLEEVCGIMPESIKNNPQPDAAETETVDDADVERFMAALQAS